MKLQKQTILITGGSSGIGLELARQLSGNNTVIVCARSDNLHQVKAMLPGVHTFTCDISTQAERQRLIDWLHEHHPSWNILVNNAAIVHKTNFIDDPQMLVKTEQEIRTNLLAPISLSWMFLNEFCKQNRSAIINITTGLVYSPRAVYPIYNATKAALHSFSQVLRIQAKELPVDVIEVMMPVVNTPWHKGDVPKIAISAEKAVAYLIDGVENGQKEVRVGKVKLLYFLSRLMPSLALKMINKVS